MFCPKCGGTNPENGKFCRTCGTNLGSVTQALTGNLPQAQPLVDRKGRPVSYERAIIKMFTGVAFIVVSISLAFSRTGEGWWFWMLIPAFTCIGTGVAQFFQLKNAGIRSNLYAPQQNALPESPGNALPPQQTQWAPTDTRYKTGNLVPPSVTDATTRHLEIDSEGKTQALRDK